VSPPLFLVEALPDAGEVRLDGPEGHHAVQVQRLRPGEALLVGDGRGAWGHGRVAATEKGALSVHLERIERFSAPDPALTVVQGIAKGDRGELAVQAMTEAGVDTIVPWAAARSIAKWRDDKPLLKWRATAREAAKQARRPWLPEVTGPEPTPAVARRLSEVFSLVLHEEASTPLSAIEPPARGTIALVVGPEGGLTPDELGVFEAAGARPVRLGRSVLRTSTAGVAALAALSVLLRRW
jgi:16S rRNA (uracil1498-N3)-methyltransferase